MNGKRALVVTIAALLLGACAELPQNEGFDAMAGRVQQQTGQVPRWQRGEEDAREIREQVQALLRQALTADSVVAIGLLNNRELQMRFEELDIAFSALRDAARLPNPVIGAGQRRGDDFSTTDLGIEFNVTALIWRAPLLRMQNETLKRTQADVADAVMTKAMQLRGAFYTWQAAEQKAEMTQTIASATAAAAQLSARQYQAGNTPRRERARQQAFHAESLLAADQARLRAAAAREQLNRLMSLWGEDTQWQAQTHLPEAPAALPALAQPERIALQNSPAIAAAKANLTFYAQALDLTRSSRFLNLATVGVDYEKQTGEPREIGPSLSLELPVFNSGDARVQRQAAQYRQAEQHLYQLAVDTRSLARESWWRWQATHAVALHYRRQILPLYQDIVEETQKRYNGMLDDIYTLLADRRAQVGAGGAYIDALRDFWIAQAQLEHALGTALNAENRANHFTQDAASENPATAASHEGH